MVYSVIVWLLLSLGVANYARKNGYEFIPFLIFSFILSPYLGFLLAYTERLVFRHIKE